jgi:hypothetical protein
MIKFIQNQPHFLNQTIHPEMFLHQKQKKLKISVKNNKKN